jgi:hypothetical protein
MVHARCSQASSSDDISVVPIFPLQLCDVDVNLILILQHLSYHLMRHDASGKSAGITLDVDIGDIVLGGGCYNLKEADTPKTMLVM